MLVSWVQQAAFAPPSISVGVKRGRPVAALIDGSRRFVLNVVGEDPKPMFKRFGKGFSLEEDAFAGLAVEASDFGPLIPECIAQLGCRVAEKVAVGDHDIYLAEVVAACGNSTMKPYVHLRSNGLSY
jgi:flavin reductase (DIM6/NTAB) family NADH-FMN oxidoreductase RutF